MQIKLIIPLCLSFCYYMNSLGQNVLISSKYGPNEPSITIDPKHPNILIAGTNLDKFFLSRDTGRTWTEGSMSSSYGVWGDPAMAIDTAGHFYYFHLSNMPGGSWIDRIVCQKSSDTGKTWTDGTFTGLNGTKAQDKAWYVINKSNNHIYVTWTQFDVYGTSNPADSSIILFSKSTDAGLTWSTPLRINKVAGDCIDDDNTVEGAIPAVGPNGEIYVSWAGPNGLVFNKSTDEGNTWMKSEIIINSIPGGWNYNIPGISRCNGLPICVCDLSNGPNRGTIYINWSDQRNGATNTDIWLVKSTDGGNNWTAPIKVNDDNSNRQQFLTWMTIDQSNGKLFFVFYDRRNHLGDTTDVYIATSGNGGNTFVNKKISELPFVPDNSIFFGDYTNITAHNGIVRPIWIRLNNGILSVWTDVSDFDHLVSDVKPLVLKNAYSFENYPNPAGSHVFVSFKVHGSSIVNLSLFDMQGKEIAVIINHETREYGKYIERIELDQMNIPEGLYFLKLEIDGEVKIMRQVKR